VSDRKTCVKCGRSIDQYARICPFCNWDQSAPLRAQAPAPQVGALPTYVPPSETRWRKPVFSAIGGLLGVIIAFVIGVQLLGHKHPVVIPGKEPAPVVQESRTPHANVTLVPDDGAPPSVEQPITSAPVTQPAQGVPNELQRTDATAVSSDEYAQMAQRAKAEKKKIATLVDPRSISGAAYDMGAEPRRASAPQSPPPMYSSQPEHIARTPPRPESQPLPRFRIRNSMVARLNLMIGADGRVANVNVVNGAGDQTGILVAAVQRWRFKPATLNGTPIAAPFAVELSFNANE